MKMEHVQPEEGKFDFEQADAIMLSGETTVGKYPLKCVEVFNRMALRVEKSGGANFSAAAELATTGQASALLKSANVGTWGNVPEGAAGSWRPARRWRPARAPD